MKRFTTTLAVLLLASLPMMAERVTPETAQKAAQNFFNNNGAKSAQLTDLSKAAGFPNLYIFTAEQGFVVMAADDCVQPILGYSLDGHFSTNDMPESFRWWLQGYSDEIQFAIDSKAKATAETAKRWKDLIDGNSKAGRATTVVEPLIQTKWNQNKYYNDLCPAVSDGPEGKAYTGCVATAMAQIMKYWSYPSTGMGSNSYTWKGQTLSANFGETTYDWNHMADYYEYYYANGTDQNANWLSEPSAEEIAAVATLMYHCGVSVEMNYGGNSTGGSGAANYYVANALKTYFNYKNTAQHKQRSFNDTDDQWITMLKAELDAHRPIQYGGQDPNPNGGGHAFVCDGYNSDDYFHFNWGWAGHYNGYFSINDLNTGANSGEAGAGNGVYTRDQEAVIGIEPGSMLPAPTNLAYTINDSNEIVLTWDEVSAAASYNVYRNGNQIGNVSENTYSETAPFGTFTYYVRCVDANGQLSIASNTITVTIAYPTPVVKDLSATLSGNNANLNWSAPEWCYPETPSATLTYGAESSNSSVGPGSTGGSFYWGNRHLANDLSEYDGKRLYKVSFYVNDPGAYECFIFKGTVTYSSSTYPSEEIAHFTTTASSTGWIDLDLDETIVIESSQDLWVFIYDPVGRAYPAVYSSFSQHTNGGYYSLHYPISSASGYLPSTFNNAAWLIKTYVTDGTYTYNLYRDGAVVAEGLTETSYNANLNNNAANLFTVKTNFNGGETEASNQIGFAKGTASVATLEMATNDKMTLSEGSKLTVSGTMSNDKAENLILEDGAQLIHSSNGVKATVKKTLSPYTSGKNDGWHFIASPVEETVIPTVENGLLANEYDLYYYDEPAHYWRNHKGTNETSNFKLNHMQGYLYANSAPTTLQFAGTLTPSTNSVTKENLSHSATELNGFNLVGNPFVCNATINQDCYVIEDSTVVLASNGKVFTPCEGAFVKATEENNHSVTFTKAGGAKSNGNNQCLDLVVFQDKSTLDRARVRMGEGTNMEKFSLDGNESTQLAFWHDGQEYAVAYMGTDTASELLINFKVAKNGTYSIGIETNSLDVDYLHLIDNMTGANIDLLQQTKYTFAAKTTDYASRFRLVFSNCEDTIGGNDDDGAFAYISNGEIVVVGDAGTASLQVVDMTGRVVVSVGGHTRCVPTTGIPAGVYVLRLIDGHNVRTQKIVIE